VLTGVTHGARRYMVNAMFHALVLVKARPDALPSLGPTLAAVDGVTEAYSVTGEWDFSIGAEWRPAYVFRYSGPSPPSGVVRRPPFAVIAPHCTQFV
jgi:hypothetical protein